MPNNLLMLSLWLFIWSIWGNFYICSLWKFTLCQLATKFIYLDQNYLLFYLIFDLSVAVRGNLSISPCNSTNYFIYFEATLLSIYIYTWLLYIFVISLTYKWSFLFLIFFHINSILPIIKIAILFIKYLSFYFQLSLSCMF